MGAIRKPTLPASGAKLSATVIKNVLATPRLRAMRY
jgi:hypothetical protein